MPKFNPVDSAVKIKDSVVDLVEELNINTEDILPLAMKVPGVKINREAFLRKELIIFFSEDVVKDAIANNPAYAGISKEEINKIAQKVISYETNKVSTISFATGVPGGFAMAATIPADLIQYFGFILRVMQKLAYLYGFEEFDLKEEEINDGTMNEILVFLGVMFGVQEANAMIKIISEAVTKKVAKDLSQRALTKGVVYPVVKKIAGQIGIKMTKQIFSKSVSRVVPVIGGFASGGLTYATFRPCSNRLKNSFSKLPICDPNTYKKTINSSTT